MIAVMNLEDFRNENEWSYAELAQRVGGINAKMAERYCKGTKPRDDQIMRRIFDISDGKVNPNDWYDFPKDGGVSAPPSEAA